MSKKKYRVHNWSDYNQCLVQRGSLTVWFDEKSISGWLSKPNLKRGRPQIYSDIAITCALIKSSISFTFEVHARISNKLDQTFWTAIADTSLHNIMQTPRSIRD